MQQERVKAEARYEQTLAAVDRILHIGKHQLSPEQPAELQRKALIEEALACYLNMLKDKPNDAKLRMQTARTYELLGSVHNSLGNVVAMEQFDAANRGFASWIDSRIP